MRGVFTVTSWPARLSAVAAESPPIPPPTIIIFIFGFDADLNFSWDQ
jgi:hypothetical protein